MDAAIAVGSYLAACGLLFAILYISGRYDFD